METSAVNVMKKLALILFVALCVSEVRAQNFVYGMAGRSGGSSGNATVPGDSVIQPAQAFVNYAHDNLGLISAAYVVDATNKGWTSALGLLEAMFSQTDSLPKIDLTGNALSDVDAILQFYADNIIKPASDVPATIYLGGGTSASPSGGRSNTSIATIVGNGGLPDSWEVKVNIGGSVVTFDSAHPEGSPAP